MPRNNNQQLSLFDQTVTEEAKSSRTLKESSMPLGATALVSDVMGLTSEQAAEILRKTGGFREFVRLPEHVLRSLPHLTEKRVKLLRQMNEWALLLTRTNSEERTQIRVPADVANLLLMEMGMLEREELRVIALDTKHYVKAIDTVYKGSLNSASVRVGEVLRMPVTLCAAAAVIVHNHPSGDPTPSPEDVRVTEMIVEAGSLLDIVIQDHVILGHNRFVSLKERGMGFK